MNYIREITAFHDSLLYNQLSTGQIALWHALMQINNKTGWQEWFGVANTVLETQTGLSRSAVLKARNFLSQKGYLDFKPRGTKATVYKMNSLTIANSEQATTQATMQATMQATTQATTPLYKRNETKHIKESSGEKKFSPPSLGEVEEYAAERGMKIDPAAFFNYYSEGKWKDGNGKPVKNWKQKMLTWESHEKSAPSKKPSKAAAKMGINAPYEQHKISDSEFDALFDDWESLAGDV